MKGSVVVPFVLAALPVCAAVLRHGSPPPAQIEVSWKDDTKIAIQWPSPADPKALQGMDEEGNWLVYGPVESYAIYVSDQTPPVPGPYEEYWIGMGNEQGDMWTWSQNAVEVPNTMVPAPINEMEHFTIPALVSGRSYWIFLVATDDDGANSFSTLLEVTTDPVDTFAPATHPLGVTSASTASLTLKWTMPGDDGEAGGAAGSYEVKMSTSPDDWSVASVVALALPGDVPSPGVQVTPTISGLQPGTPYYFRLIVSDTSGNSSAASMASGITLQVPVEVGGGGGEAGGGACSAAAGGPAWIAFAMLVIVAFTRAS